MKRTWLTLTAALALFVLPTGCSQDELPAPAPVRPVEFPDPEPEPDPDTIPDTTFDPDYESSDFSEDGKAVLLQRATEGRGIDIVLMGDAFSDRLVANGVYMQKMRQAAASASALRSPKPSSRGRTASSPRTICRRMCRRACGRAGPASKFASTGKAFRTFPILSPSCHFTRL